MKEIRIEKARRGMPVLLLTVLAYILSIALLIVGIVMVENSGYYYDGVAVSAVSPVGGILLIVIAVLWMLLGWIFCLGLKVLKPQEALVLTLFGKYVGTLREPGFFFVNPFCTSVNPAAKTKLNQSGDVGTSAPSIINVSGASVSTGEVQINNNRQKINDCLGNPVEIGIAVIWRVVDTAKAVFDVDKTGDGIADEGSLRGSSDVVASRIRDEIQQKVVSAGLEIIEARITYLAYAPEIAAVMLQRQQASAIIDARKMIVDGAVGMVEMALERLSEKNTVELDEERKAAMVSNLLVVLCGNHDAQPVVNSGSLY